MVGGEWQSGAAAAGSAEFGVDECEGAIILVPVIICVSVPCVSRLPPVSFYR